MDLLRFVTTHTLKAIAVAVAFALFLAALLAAVS